MCRTPIDPPRLARYVAPVQPQIAAAIAAWLPALGLAADPGPGVKDLRGQTISIPRFTDEDTCHFFFPRRTLYFHQRMVKALIRMLARRGGKIVSVLPTPEQYARWLDAQRKTDTPELRFGFASRPPDPCTS